jgi:hypothetical protein
VDAVLRTRIITAFFIAVAAFTLLFLAPVLVFRVALAILLMAGRSARSPAWSLANGSCCLTRVPLE